MDPTIKPVQSNVALIKQFFEAEPNGRKVTMEELKKLSGAEREELGTLCKIALGL